MPTAINGTSSSARDHTSRSTSSVASSSYKPTRTVLVLGASYAGHRAIQLLVKTLPPGWRVVVLERNTHANHLYAFPRVAVVPKHENKVFIPYTNMFNPAGGAPEHSETAGHTLIHGCLTKLNFAPTATKPGLPPYGRGIATYMPLQGASCCKEPGLTDADQLQVRFDYVVYALGSHLPPPINLWSSTRKSPAAGQAVDASAPRANVCCMSRLSQKINQQMNLNGDAQQQASASPSSSPSPSDNAAAVPCRGSKKEGISWLQEAQSRIRKASSIVVIGAGALGVQFASDIASFYGTEKYQSEHADPAVPPKKVTLLVSGKQILPRFSPWMHEQAMEAFDKLGVQVMLGARANLSAESLAEGDHDGKERTITTLDGRQVEAELILFCTGQKPCTSYLLDALRSDQKSAVDATTGMAKVNRHLQLALPSTTTTADGDDANADPQTTPDLDNIFVIGDAADAFGALNAGHTAWDQASVAASNICTLIARGTASASAASVATKTTTTPTISESSQEPTNPNPLQIYTPPQPAIKVSLGLDEAISQTRGVHARKKGKEDGCHIDLNTGSMWTRRGLKDGGELGDYRE